MILFTINGVALYSKDLTYSEVVELLKQYKEDTILETEWLVDEDWEEKYHSVDYFIDWFHESSTKHLGLLDLPGLMTIPITPEELQDSTGDRQ